jgi:DNA modification methylase
MGTVKVEIKQVKLSEVQPNPDNPRTITGKDMDRLVKSLTDFPEMLQLREIVVDENLTVLGGNMRLLALRKIGAKEATAKIVKGLTAEQKREFVIKDNSGFGDWDMEALANEWSDLPLAEWGVGLPEDWLSTPEETKDAEPQIDRAEELNKKWGVKSGDLWQIGEHRLLCGDSTKAKDVERVMGGDKADMMFVDPPYGVDYDGGHFHSGDVKIKRARTKLSGDINDGLYEKFLPVVLPFIDGPVYMWFADKKGANVYSAVLAVGCEVHALIIWHKINATYAAINAQYKQRHEPCLYFKPKGSTLRWCGPTDECTVWEEKRDASNEFHPTQKPIELSARAIKNHDVAIIADFFAGSGSTLVSCQNLNRKCMGIEISPAYCAVILQRMADAFPGIEIKRLP